MREPREINPTGVETTALDNFYVTSKKVPAKKSTAVKNLKCESAKMTKKEVQLFIKQRFDMELCEFIKSRVYDEKLYDYEISQLLNVSKGLVSNLRKLCGTKKADAFTRRFERIYGTGAVDRFKRLIENTDNSLSDVAKTFRFSREYARQAYQKIYGYPYTRIHRKKLEARRKKQVLEKNQNSHQTRAVNRFIQRLRSIGIMCDISAETPKHVLLDNGYKVILKFSSKSTKLGKKQYFKINYAKSPDTDCDFFVCLCGDSEERTHYIIPRNTMPKSTLSLSPQSGPDESKYAQFKEAWHLLSAAQKANT